MLQKADEEAKTKVDRLQNELAEREVQLKIWETEIEGLQAQVTDTEESANLSAKQSKARSKVPDQRIMNIEQQLSSLITVFNLERGERTEEHKTQTVLKQSLVGADSEVAHQIKGIREENQTPHRSPGPTAAVSSVAFASPHRVASLPSYSTPPRRVSSRSEPFDSHAEVGVAPGFLLKKEFAGWKKKYVCLHGNLAAGVFTLSFGYGPGIAAKGHIAGIRTAISQVQLCHDFHNVVKVSPGDSRSQFVYLAATSQEDLGRWMTALQMATEGLTSESTPPPSQQHYYPVGSRVIIVDLVHHPEYD